MKFVLPLLMLICLLSNSAAQSLIVPRDTSYTLSSALAKALKNNRYDNILITPARSGYANVIDNKNDLVYKQISQRTLLADLYFPVNSEKNKPAIVLVHGGGWRSGDKSLMKPMAERLAANGYFVMTPEYRLSLEAQYPAAVFDLYDALDWLVKNAENYQIDTNQLVVMGCSAGAQLAALVSTTYNQNQNLYGLEARGRIVASIVVDGVLAFKHADSKEGKIAGWWLGGSWEEKPDIWTEASALTHVDQNTPPTLFLASIYPRFLAGRQDFIAKLDQYETYSETHFMDRAPHSFWLFNPWYEPTMDFVLRFLDSNLINPEFK